MSDRSDRIRTNLVEISDRIASAERTFVHDVEIVAVTKTFSPQVVEAAVAAGCTAIGENYAQDLLTKREVIESFAPTQRPRVDFIGQLQSNKVRQLVGLVDRYCTVDRPSLVKELVKRAPGAEVLIQVDTTGGAGKGGCDPATVSGLIDRCRDGGLDLVGLLTVGPTGEPATAAAGGFVRVRALVDEHGLDVCSMGMTADLEVAIAAGATSVRIGSALFGARPEITVHPESNGRG